MAAAERGDASATEALFVALYSELHGLARRELARGGAGVTLSATTVLHEAYLDISGRPGTAFPDRARFMGYAARVMRGLIIDHSRRHRALRRGGQFELTSLDVEPAAPASQGADLEGISDALDALARMDPPLAEVVDLKFFCGFSFAEIAAMRHTCERTVQRQWDRARIYLRRSVAEALPER
jgi:RNA polymerase sigma factor (TIGR02999 family)